MMVAGLPAWDRHRRDTKQIPETLTLGTQNEQEKDVVGGGISVLAAFGTTPSPSFPFGFLMVLLFPR